MSDFSEDLAKFQSIPALGKAVTFFGSARLKKGSFYYEAAKKLARSCVQSGFCVISGGGGGIMMGANEGAFSVRNAENGQDLLGEVQGVENSRFGVDTLSPSLRGDLSPKQSTSLNLAENSAENSKIADYNGSLGEPRVNLAQNSNINSAENLRQNQNLNSSINSHENSSVNSTQNSREIQSQNLAENSRSWIASTSTKSRNDGVSVNLGENSAENLGTNFAQKSSINSHENSSVNSTQNSRQNQSQNLDQNSSTNSHQNHAQSPTNPRSVGFNIILPFEQKSNDFLDLNITFKSLPVRKLALIEKSAAFVIFPGGFGTLDEFAEVLTLKQLGFKKVPIFAVGSEFWRGFDSFVKSSLLGLNLISQGDEKLYEISDDLDYIMQKLREI